MCQQLHKLRVFMVRIAQYKEPLRYLCNLKFISKLTLHCLLFQVGCGAIGCEMLKNFALLGVGLAKSSGEVVSSSLFGYISL